MATISFSTVFNLTGTPAFNFTDTSAYVAQGVALVDVVGNFTITSPSGVVIHNNVDITNAGCDVDIVTALTNQTTIVLPIDSEGLVEPGVYTILYSVWDSNLNAFSYITNTYTYSFIEPEIDILQTVDCLSPLFTSKDNTDYVVDGVTPTYSLLGYSNTIDYPYGSNGEGSPTIGGTTTTTTSTFYQGTQTTEIAAGLLYTYPDGHVVQVTITGTKEVLVDCKDVCGIYCCIRSIEQQMNDFKTTNKVEYKTYSDLFAKIMGYVGLALLAIRCGKSDDVNDFLAEIRLLSHCTSDCGCSGDEPVQVTGLGGLVNNIVVNSCGNGITVTPVEVGNTITYTVCLSSAFVTLVNSFYNTVVVAGNNTTVSGPVIAGTTHTYTVNALRATVASADGSITVTAGAVAAGVQNYDLSKVISTVVEATDYNTPFVVVAATSNQDVTGAIGVAAVAGTYLIIYECDVYVDNVANFQLIYRLDKTGGVAINNDNTLLIGAGNPTTMKMVSIAVAALTAAQTVKLNVDAPLVAGAIHSRSITMVKIA